MENGRPVVESTQFKAMLKEILEKLNFPPPRYECERNGPYHLPNFVVIIRFEDKQGGHEICGPHAYTKKDAENDASMRVIKHLGQYYDIVMKDINEEKLVELKYEFKDLKEAYEELWKSLIETSKELKELKERMMNLDPKEELDSVSSKGVRVCPKSCACHVYQNV
ncbi:Double-stranded RNA-binding domain-containing protein [Dioscorea alata]|uniref:Double-stranded RNA-binding domain-containing protein n=1 Tax=Dioscorea alata TaxID=55571 RepID=A0ACB7U608_DIOAL|nr:Double-stranded RNA-binding domain-containing protein [Dioscorea alata]